MRTLLPITVASLACTNNRVSASSWQHGDRIHWCHLVADGMFAAVVSQRPCFLFRLYAFFLSKKWKGSTCVIPHKAWPVDWGFACSRHPYPGILPLFGSRFRLQARIQALEFCEHQNIHMSAFFFFFFFGGGGGFFKWTPRYNEFILICPPRVNILANK